MDFNYEFEAIGTIWRIDVIDAPFGLEQEFLLEKVKNRIEEFDKNYSRFREDSLVWEISKNLGVYTLPEDSLELFEIYKKMYDLTAGRFTPLIGNVLEQAGYDSKYSFNVGKIESPYNWQDAIEFNFPILKINAEVMLDFGAAGKGYLVDIIARLLKELGSQKFCIDAGGDILVCGLPPLRVGLENPGNIKEVIGVASIFNKSICGSAGNRRKWGGFHHIIDPVSLKSPTEIIGVWVVAESCVLADALTTGLFFCKPEVFIPHFTFEYLILNSDYSVERSPEFPAELFH